MTSQDTPKRVAIYSRISVDKDGKSLSPDRQNQLCRQLAEARGWEVLNPPFEDRDKSGWRAGVKRSGWNALLATVRRGEVDVVMAYSLSRLGRRTRDLLALSDLLNDHGVALVVYDTNIDTTSPSGRVFFTIVAALAELEAEQTSVRVASAHKVAAERGEMPYSGSRCFGYQGRAKSRVGDERVARESKAIRYITAQILAGESLSSMARWLNDEGVTTTAGNTWSSTQLSQALRSPRLAGLRKHGNRVLPGNWEPVLAEEDWLGLVSELDRRKNQGTGRNVPAHLLTGMIVCGRCGQNLRAAHFRQANGRMFDRYQCVPRPGLPNCGGNAASKSSVDKFVTESFLAFLSQAQMRPVEEGARSLAEVKTDVHEVEARLTRLARDHYVDGILTQEIFDTTYLELTRQLTELQAAQRLIEGASADRAMVLPPGDRHALEAWWESASLGDRREALARAIGEVSLRPAARRGGNKFDTNRVAISWRWTFYIRAAKSERDHMTEDERAVSDREQEAFGAELDRVEAARS